MIDLYKNIFFDNNFYIMYDDLNYYLFIYSFLVQSSFFH